MLKLENNNGIILIIQMARKITHIMAKQIRR